MRLGEQGGRRIKFGLHEDGEEGRPGETISWASFALSKLEFYFPKLFSGAEVILLAWCEMAQLNGQSLSFPVRWIFFFLSRGFIFKAMSYLLQIIFS